MDLMYLFIMNWGEENDKYIINIQKKITVML